MRTYPRNSPQAAARLVSLALLADGHVDRAELDALQRNGACRDLGLSDEEFNAVLHAFCEDLLATSAHTWGAACLLDADALDALMAEVDDPALRSRVLRLCTEVVHADRHVADGESLVLRTALDRWDDVLPRGAVDPVASQLLTGRARAAEGSSPRASL